MPPSPHMQGKVAALQHAGRGRQGKGAKSHPEDPAVGCYGHGDVITQRLIYIAIS